MIRITRGECPAALANAVSPTGKQYNAAGVVDALWEMQHGKCCYCERALPEKGHLKAVEHFAPQAIFKGLKNEWKNLLLACAQCNGKKSNLFPVILSTQENEDKVIYVREEQAGQPAMIDPCMVDPEQHIVFEVVDQVNYGVIRARGDSLMGTATITTVGLDSKFYTDLRYRHAMRVLRGQISLLFEAVHDKKQNEIITARAQVERLLSADSEFAGFSRAYARQEGVDRPEVGVTIPH